MPPSASGARTRPRALPVPMPSTRVRPTNDPFVDGLELAKIIIPLFFLSSSFWLIDNYPSISAFGKSCTSVHAVRPIRDEENDPIRELSIYTLRRQQ